MRAVPPAHTYQPLGWTQTPLNLTFSPRTREEGIGRERSPQNLVDRRGACCKHHQPVKAERHPACFRHRRKRGEEILIDRKIPRAERRLLPLLARGNVVVWMYRVFGDVRALTRKVAVQ